MSLVLHYSRSSCNASPLEWFLDILHTLHLLAHFWQGAQSLAPAAQNGILTSKRGPSIWSFLTCWFGNVLRAATSCSFSASQFPKVFCNPSMLYTFHFHICLAPRRRAFFRHLNFLNFFNVLRSCQFFALLTWNVLRATCVHFSTSQLPKVVQGCVLYACWLAKVLRASPVC